MSPEEVKHWCDNKSTVTANTWDDKPCRPSAIIDPDAGIILAILHHKRGLKATVDCQHVPLGEALHGRRYQVICR